jgi:rhodanese-related sulfurtransferase
MKIINKILILSITFIMVSCGVDDSKKYVISAEDALTAYLNKDDIYSSEKIANILLCKKADKYQLIDIRTPHEFAINHLPGAINIPSKDILDEEYFETLNQDEKINVLYSSEGYQAVDSYMMLKQLNFKNIKVALGGFDFIHNYIVDSYGIKTGIYDDEKPRYDFIRLVAGTQAPKKDSITKPNVINVNPNKVIKDFDEECPDLN